MFPIADSNWTNRSCLVGWLVRWLVFNGTFSTKKLCHKQTEITWISTYTLCCVKLVAIQFSHRRPDVAWRPERAASPRLIVGTPRRKQVAHSSTSNGIRLRKAITKCVNETVSCLETVLRQFLCSGASDSALMLTMCALKCLYYYYYYIIIIIMVWVRYRQTDRNPTSISHTMSDVW